MNFQNPAALLWALPLMGVIVALYLLKMRRKDVVVPATFLWPERTDEIRANSLFQKLKFNWLMVLQLLAVALLVLGLARWQTRQRGLTGSVTVAVIDASASMGATDAEGTRFETALNRVEGMIGGIQAGDQLALIEAGPVPRVVFPLSNDQGRMRRSLESVRATDAEADMGEALRLASGLAGQVEGAKIVLVSDGVFEPVEDFAKGEAEFVFVQIGESSRNVAIQSLGTSPTPDGEMVYVGLKNHGLATATGALTLEADGKPFWSVNVAIAEGQTWGRTASVPAGAKLVEARLETDDILKSDNWMATPVGRGAAMRVLLVSGGNVFLERALALDPRVTLDKAGEVPATERAGTPGPGTYNLVVFDGTEPVAVKSPGVLSFGRAPVGMSVTGSGTFQGGSFVQATAHPLVEGVSFENVYVDRARSVRAGGTTRALVEADKGPLVLASEGSQKSVFVTFGLFDSDFPLNYGFPIFISNVLDFVTTTAAASDIVVKTGQVVGFPVDGEGPFSVEAPDGTVIDVPTLEGRALVRSFDRAGVYQVGSGEGRRPVYVTLRSDRESDVRPVEILQVGGGQVQAQGDFVRFADLWKPLALLALLVMGFEWWFYARRS